MEFGPAAQPLTRIREDLVFVRGLYNEKAEFEGIITIDPWTVILGNKADEGPDCFGCL